MYVGGVNTANCETDVFPSNMTRVRLDVEFHGLSLRLRNSAQRCVLEGVSGRLRAGHLTAIMGPSGAGT